MTERPELLPGLVPRPDPTLLTTQQLLREIDSLREQVKSWVDSLQSLMESRLDDIDTHYEEKFRSIQTQFRERDIRTDQTAQQVKLAVDAALQAQKEAAGEQAKSFSAATTKSETSINKQIEGLDGKITDVKDRVNKVESMIAAAMGSRSEFHEDRTFKQHGSQNLVQVIAACISLGALLISLAVFFSARGEPKVTYIPPEPTATSR